MSLPECSAASLQAGEALAGTAVENVDRWLLLEVTGTWAPKAIESEAIPPPVRARLAQWLEAPRTRLQLIRRPGRTGKRPELMVVRAARGSESVSRVELDRHEDVLDLDLDDFGSISTDPICLVCAHGRRDRCCGVLGSAVFRAIQSEDIEVWQTSHLGGHRFAACALWLPDGLMYGRVRPEQAPAFVTAQRARNIGDLDLFRGRCSYDRPTQAAEIILRRELGDLGVHAVEWKGTTQLSESSWEARFQVGSEERAIRVRMDDTGQARPPSCGASPEPVMALVEG